MSETWQEMADRLERECVRLLGLKLCAIDHVQRLSDAPWWLKAVDRATRKRLGPWCRQFAKGKKSRIDLSPVEMTALYHRIDFAYRYCWLMALMPSEFAPVYVPEKESELLEWLLVKAWNKMGPVDILSPVISVFGAQVSPLASPDLSLN